MAFRFVASTLFSVALASVALSSPAHAQAGVAISGTVTNQERQPIAGAMVDIPELGRATNTASDGRYRIVGVPAGRYTIAVRRVGYLTSATPVVVADAPKQVDVTLSAGAVPIEPVNVTATRAPITALSSPLSTSTLSGEELHPEGGISLAHAIAGLPGVRTVSSGQQIGKPMIRGLFGPRVAVFADGSRVEDYSWSDEDGPSIDARLAERVEVIRGPASVLYGSEALGGVVNVIPAALSYSADASNFRRYAVEAYGGSNNIELGTALKAEGGWSRYAWRGMATGRVAQNYQTPGGVEQNSSFWAFNGEGAFGIRGDHGNTTFRVAHYGGELHLLESSGPEVGDPTGGPVRQTLDDRLQVTNNYLVNGLRLETKAQWQRHGLTEVSDDCVPVPPATTCVKVKDKVAFALALNTGTLDVMLHHTIGEYITGTVGVSGMYQMSGTTGPIFLVPSATTNNAAAYAFEQATFGIVSFVAGGRADHRSLSSDALSQITRPADTRSWSAMSGDGGIVIRPITGLAFVGNVGTGWRAPNLFDLYINGPNIADARYEIGDPTLKTETSTNLEGGVRWEDAKIRAEFTAYQNTVNNYIYTTPTPDFLSGLRVYRHVQADARLSGVEASAEVRVTDPLTLKGSFDLVQGTDRRTESPLPLIAPPRTIVGARLQLPGLGAAHSAWIGANVEYDAKQTRLNANDYATNSYTLVNIDAAIDQTVHARPFHFTLGVRNLTNTSYKDYLSRYKEFALGPGVNIILKASTGAW